MHIGPEEYVENLYASHAPEYGFRARTIEECRAWRDRLKEAFTRDLGGFPGEKTALHPRVVEETECGGYVRQRVVITTDELLDMPLYLLIPKGCEGRLPVVITCPGHGTGSRDNVGLNPDGTFKSGDQGYSKSFALELVKRGFLVVSPELLGFAERMFQGDMNRWPEVRNSCHRLSTYLMTMGKTMAGVRVYELMRVIDYLETRPEADAGRIGCMGISGGGWVCAFTTALDERIRAAVVSGYTNTFKKSILAMQHCICNFVPGLALHAEMPDLIAMIAPRPLLIEAGERDRNFPMDGVREALEKLETVYGAWNARDRLERDLFDGGHEISGRMAYDWLARWL